MTEPARPRPVGPDLEGPATDAAAILEPGRTSALAALRYRDFRLFWFGLLVSNTGTWMQMFGQGYLVVQLAILEGTPQLAPLYLGLVGLARAVPGLTFGLLAGAVADRSDRRRLLLLTQVGAGLVASVLAILTITGRISVVEILLLAALSSAIFAFDAPTRQSMVPRLVPERDLMSAIGLNSAAFNGPQLLGPVIGGVLYIPLGIGGLFAINALSYLAVVAALLKMNPIPVAHQRQGVSMLLSIREGLGYARREPVLLWVLVITAATALLARPYIMLLPAVAEQVLRVGAVELSLLFGASGLGALGGALVTASLGSLERRGVLLLGAAFSMGVLLIAFAVQNAFVPALLLVVLLGFAMMLFMGMANTLLQTRAPDHLRGRVMSLQSVLMMGLVPLGTMLLGSLGTFVGVDLGLALGGAVVAGVSVLAALRSPALRRVTAKGRRRVAPA